MNPRERWVILVILLGTALFVGTDLVTDAGEGASLRHLILESVVAVSALGGVIFLLKDSFRLKKSLADEVVRSQHLRDQAEAWRGQAKAHIEGLSQEIEKQLSQWHLTSAEKEVALLLLKGLSLKEIADIRRTTEKTTRAQSTAIYQKAGLAGRSELAAFFLEDLLQPKSE